MPARDVGIEEGEQLRQKSRQCERVCVFRGCSGRQLPVDRGEVNHDRQMRTVGFVVHMAEVSGKFLGHSRVQEWHVNKVQQRLLLTLDSKTTPTRYELKKLHHRPRWCGDT